MGSSWDAFMKLCRKVFGKALWTYSAYELGSNSQDTDEITNSIVKYQNSLNSRQIVEQQEQNFNLEIILGSLVIIVILFILAICYKIFVKREVNIDRQIRLETIRATHPVNNNNNNNQNE